MLALVPAPACPFWVQCVQVGELGMPRESNHEFALLRLVILPCTNADTRGNKEEPSVRRRRNLIHFVAAEVKAG